MSKQLGSPVVWRIVCIGLMAMVLAGCKKPTNVSFVRSAVPPLPLVYQNGNKLNLTYAVVNGKNQSYPPGSFKVHVKAHFFTPYSDGVCTRNEVFSLGLLEPGAKQVHQDIAFGKGQYAGDPCNCGATNCYGYIMLELRRSNGDLAPGPNTKLQVTWEEGAQLADMSVTDQSP